MRILPLIALVALTAISCADLHRQTPSATSASPSSAPSESGSPVTPIQATPPATSSSPETPPELQRLSGGFRIEQVYPSVSFDRTVALSFAGDGSGRAFLVLQQGRLMEFDARDEAADAKVFLDIRERVNDRGNEEGLLGLSLDPDFPRNGYLYVYYTAADPRRGVLSRFTANPDGNGADPASELVVLEVAQPYSNHNGGQVLFGPDGYLYLSLGDGGNRGDPQRNGQDLSTLLGTILRLGVGSLDTYGMYAIPADNPFMGQESARGEIWAYGLRNPWRFTFDRLTGELWATDVGQNRREEVDIIRPGRNYGWNVMEGSDCYPRPQGPCDETGLEMPISEYGREDGCSITGGYVYRGSRLPALYGAYIYGDFCSGKIWALDGASSANRTLLADTELRISSFAEDPTGELYILSFDKKIYRLTR